MRLRGLITLVLALAFPAAPTPATAQADDVVVVLVRHAERQEDGTRDPPISPEGRERARSLARLIADVGITRIYSTDYKRTRQTAAPFAEASGLEVELYDPVDLPAFAEHLRQSPGRHLVVGHSNTTPALVEALGGDPGSPIEEMEYDRLYVLTLEASGASTVLLRFGPGG